MQAENNTPLTDEIQRLKNQAILEKEEKAMEVAKKLSNENKKKKIEVKEIISDEAKQYISKIIIDMNGQKLDLDFSSVVNRYKNKSLTRKQIFELVKELTDILYHKGYVTSGIGLKSKDISNGTLSFIIHWGMVNDFLVNNENAKLFKNKAMLKTLPNIKNKVLNLYDIDQIIEILNTTNKSATVTVVAAEQQRNSNLNIELIRNNYPQLNLSMNNSGEDNNANGRNQLTLGLSGSDILGINDIWNFSTSYRLYKESKANSQRNYSLSYTQPFGYSSLEFRISQSDYKKSLKGYNGNYDSNGLNKNLNIKFSHILLRDKESIWSFYLETEFRKKKNYLINRLTNNNHYNKISIGLSYITSLLNGKLYSDISYTNGLNWFNADKGAYNGKSEKALRIFNFNMNWQKPILFSSKIFNYQLRIGMQYSPNFLYADNQISLGDEYTVRGFKGGVISGDNGIYLSQTLSYPFYFKYKYLNSVEPLVGFDIGQVYDRVLHQKKSISGMAAGMRAKLKQISVSFIYSHLLHNVKENRLGNAPVYYFNASASF